MPRSPRTKQSPLRVWLAREETDYRCPQSPGALDSQAWDKAQDSKSQTSSQMMPVLLIHASILRNETPKDNKADS